MSSKEIEKTVEEAAKWWGVKPRVELKYRYPPLSKPLQQKYLLGLDFLRKITQK